MRFVQTSTLVLSLLASVSFAGACAGGDEDSISNEGAGIGATSSVPTTGATAPGPGATLTATTTAAPVAMPTMSAAPTSKPAPPTTATGTMTTSTPTMMPTAPSTTSSDDQDDPAPTASATDAPPTMSQMPPTPTQQCTDVPPTEVDEENKDTTCATWAEWGECENPTNWLDSFCDASCGRCTPSSGTSTDPGPMMSGGTDTEPDDDGALSDDNPYPPITGGQQGWGSRYWDCCKASCGWRGNASNPVVSCDKSDNGLGVSDERNSCEANGMSGAFTCHNMAPWAYSTKVSYGYAAINGVNCGTCFQIEFTGGSHNGGNDPGCAAIKGKTMIVQATNIGGIEMGQFDLLIPGGGVGLLNGCAGQWGVDNAELGAQYGGFLPACKQAHAGDHNGVKQCMRDKCQSIFGTRNLTELYDGCMWFADWFEAADNPQFNYTQIDCPQAVSDRSAGR